MEVVHAYSIFLLGNFCVYWINDRFGLGEFDMVFYCLNCQAFLNDYACTYVYRKKIELLHNSFSCKQVNVMMMSIDPMDQSLFVVQKLCSSEWEWIESSRIICNLRLRGICEYAQVDWFHHSNLKTFTFVLFFDGIETKRKGPDRQSKTQYL